MDVIAYLLPISLLMGGIGLGAFIWSLRSKQMDDLDGAAMRILQDDDEDTCVDTPKGENKTSKG